MADVYGIPAQVINKSAACWQTTLDDYLSSTHDLLWFFKPANTLHWSESAVGSPYQSGWQTSLELDTGRSDWLWEVKVRAKQGHVLTTIQSGTLECVIVLSSLEEQVNAVRDTLLAIGRGEKVQSYEIAGRQLKNYTLEELQKLYNMLKLELQAQKSRQKQRFGFVHGRYGWGIR